MPAHAARAPPGGRSDAGSVSTLHVEMIKLYQRSVRYELRWGQLYARTIVAFADRRHTGRAESVVLGDTCMVPRFIGN